MVCDFSTQRPWRNLLHWRSKRVQKCRRVDVYDVHDVHEQELVKSRAVQFGPSSAESTTLVSGEPKSILDSSSAHKSIQSRNKIVLVFVNRFHEIKEDRPVRDTHTDTSVSADGELLIIVTALV